MGGGEFKLTDGPQVSLLGASPLSPVFLRSISECDPYSKASTTSRLKKSDLHLKKT